MPEKRRVLLIALDSAEPELMMAWQQQGLMPNLKTLLESGAWSRVSTTPGFGAGAMWPSVYTGMNIGNHGRYFFEQIKPGTYQTERVSDEASVKASPLWKLLSDQGNRVCVIDGDRAPLIDNLNGRQISDWTPHDPVGTVRSWPPGFADEVIKDFGTDPLNGCADVFTGGPGLYVELRDKLIKRVAQKTAMARRYLRESDWDFFMVGYGDAHDVGHMCWHLHDASHAGYDPTWVKKHGDPIRDVYQALDAAIGELLDEVDSNTFVVLFAGPGMEPDYTGNYLLTSVLQRLQHSAPADSSRIRAGLSAFYKKYLPFSLRRKLEAYVKKKTEKSRELARSKSRYFQVPHNQNSGAIRINLVGREPNGIVTPGVEYDTCCESLKQDLMALVDANTGKRIVREVVKVKDHCHGDHLDFLPDLLVIWERHGPIRAISSEKTGLIRKTYGGSRTGDHSNRCMLVIRGPGVKTGEMARPPSVESVAPTMSEILGFTMKDADGKSFLAEILD